MKIEINIKACLWTGVEAYCPICNKTFTDWFCPSCGLPKKNSKYARYKDLRNLTSCGSYHFRPQNKSYEDFQLCPDCGATNPFKAKFCRSCGRKIQSEGMDINAHGWVDLGLSVLWSTESTRWNYRWMRTLGEYRQERMEPEEYNKLPEVDPAVEEYGVKWRTPTKDEVQELIDKCKWEKILVWEHRSWMPHKRLRALKAIGPNGNHIIFLPGGEGSSIVFWTSTKSETRDHCAQLFRYDEPYQKTTDIEASWLSTPFDKILPFEHPDARKIFQYPVRPVADKKWKGKL